MEDDERASSIRPGEESENVDQRFLRIATPYERIGGAFVDGIVRFVIFGLPTFGLPRLGLESTTLTLVTIPILLSFLYDWLWVAFKGATPGKLIVGTRVVRESDGGHPSIIEAALRSSIYLVALIPSIGGVANWLLVIVGFALLFADRNARTPWDRLARTVVIDKLEMEASAAAEALATSSDPA